MMQEIRSEIEPRTHFTMIPWLIDDADLDPYEHRLLCHYYRVGTCWESTQTTAEHCKMAVGSVVNKRKSLAEKGWIRIQENGNGGLAITILDRWPENNKSYNMSSPDEQEQELCSSGEQDRSSDEQNGNKSYNMSSPDEPKYIYINKKNNTRARARGDSVETEHIPHPLEEKFTELTGFFAPHWSTATYQDDWLTPLRQIEKAGSAPARLEHGVKRMRELGYIIANPGSVLTAALNWSTVQPRAGIVVGGRPVDSPKQRADAAIESIREAIKLSSLQPEELREELIRRGIWERLSVLGYTWYDIRMMTDGQIENLRWKLYDGEKSNKFSHAIAV